MMRDYPHKDIEAKWREKWLKEETFRAPDAVEGKDNAYYLVEFPYPSGDLHVGHWYAFSVTDIAVRQLRMKGKNVLFPIGFDAFGLPAENAAIKHGTTPAEWTVKNMETMTTQLEATGASFDWSRKVTTCDPAYYRWTQWIFEKFYERGLAYRGLSSVNWCPKDQTVLANEQVVGGKCDRCGSDVEPKQMTQWMYKITDYAEKLLQGLDTLPWSDEIKDAQRNWIGKSEGAKIRFKMQDAGDKSHEIEVFTTRPDTIYGATFMVVGPEHPLLKDNAIGCTNAKEVSAYIAESAKRKTEDRFAAKEKTGVKLEGVSAVNPATGKEIPIFVADYVLGDVGTGAIMAVPAHDERDYAFAQAFHLPIIEVIAPKQGQAKKDEVFTDRGVLVNSGECDGMTSEEATDIILKNIGGAKEVRYRLHDWILSRQRYWGAPIPVVYDPEGNPHLVKEEHLPWLLPTDVVFLPTGESPLKGSQELRERVTRLYGEGWTPEFDTMDTFVDSSWYFLRYLDSENNEAFANREKMDAWLPVNVYSGGAEHTTMHLLYSRFFMQALYDLGLVPCAEPYTMRRNRGIILGGDGQKMSKSKGNVINPDEFVEKLGSDAVRMYMAFIGPYNEVGSFPWNTDSILGVRRFLDRVWKYASAQGDEGGETPEETLHVLHETMKRVTESIESFAMNTGVSQLMILFNHLTREGAGAIARADWEMVVKLLAPYAPHMAEELWANLGHTTSVHLEEWPVHDETVLARARVTIAVQINGKVRDTLEVEASAGKEELEMLALASEKVKKVLDGKEPKKVIVVAGRVVNIVTSE